MKFSSRFLYSSIVGLLIFSMGCSPKVYLIDRQTVLEDEAAGEWPDFERGVLENSKAQGPTPFTTTKNSGKKKRLYNVLNGELTHLEPSQVSEAEANGNGNGH